MKVGVLGGRGGAQLVLDDEAVPIGVSNEAADNEEGEERGV